MEGGQPVVTMGMEMLRVQEVCRLSAGVTVTTKVQKVLKSLKIGR